MRSVSVYATHVYHCQIFLKFQYGELMQTFDIKNECFLLGKFLSANMREIINILINYEPYNTAVDEISRVCNTLNNIEKEIDYIQAQDNLIISSFLPLNLPLYSMILFAFIPSFMSENVYLRPPIAMRNVINDLITFIPHSLMSRVNICNVTRKEFRNIFLQKSDVVVFTGRSENAKILVDQYLNRETLFIYNGAGVNPYIIGPCAKMEPVVDSVINTRLYNSGQDCAGPDYIFIHSSVSNHFYEKLISKLNKVNVGSTKDVFNQVGQLLDGDVFKYIIRVIDDAHDNKRILYGGKYNIQERLVFPTIINSDLGPCESGFELFSPIFRTVHYNKITDLEQFFNSEVYKKYEMYLSVFGEAKGLEKINSKSIFLRGKSILDIEQGNSEFGGYGEESSYIIYNDNKVSKPILISREISAYHKKP